VSTEKLAVAQMDKELLAFIGARKISTFSYGTATGTYSEPDIPQFTSSNTCERESCSKMFMSFANVANRDIWKRQQQIKINFARN
jgi:hypothetical protein